MDKPTVEYEELLKKISEVKVLYLAHLLGVSSGTIYSWLRHKSKPPLYRIMAVDIIFSEDFKEVFEIIGKIDISKLEKYQHYNELMLFLSRVTGIDIQYLKTEMLDRTKLIMISKIILDLTRLFNI